MNEQERMIEYGIMLAILNQLYNKGEFTKEEYERMRARFKREYGKTVGKDIDDNCISW